jgi:hypothetical protein
MAGRGNALVAVRQGPPPARRVGIASQSGLGLPPAIVVPSQCIPRSSSSPAPCPLSLRSALRREFLKFRSFMQPSRTASQNHATAGVGVVQISPTLSQKRPIFAYSLFSFGKAVRAATTHPAFFRGERSVEWGRAAPGQRRAPGWCAGKARRAIWRARARAGKDRRVRVGSAG